MRQLSVYRKTKPVYLGLKTARKLERYREENRSDLTMYEAAVRHFREQGLKKLPALSKLCLLYTSGDRCILQLRGLPPFYSRKYDLKQHPNYKFTAEADKKNAFNLDRLINRRRRPGLAEACEVYEVDVPAEALTDEDEDILNYDDLDDPDAFV